MLVKTFIVDAFTSEPFKGNPAGVCLLDQPLPDPKMQAIAAELNLSETAFLVPVAKSNQTFFIRYFTPTMEIAFCGHATLGSAKVVIEKLGLEKVTFVTHHQLVLHAQKEGGSILMQFPLYGYKKEEPTPPALFEALGLPVSQDLYYSEDLQMLILEVADKETLIHVNPDFNLLLRAVTNAKGLAVTTKSTDTDYDFYSRCFWPWVGINEDPVTGSAHSVLAKFWADRLQKTELKAYQLSARGGYLHLSIKPENVLEVRSQAQIVLEGLLNLA